MSGVGPVHGNQYASAVNAMSQFGSGVNIPEIGLLIQMERNNILQDQVKDQFNDMQARNQWLKEATDALNALRTARPKEASGKVELKDVKFNDSNGKEKTLEAFFKDNGISKQDGGLNQTQYDNMIANLKASIDTVNTNSQLDMVRMQGLMDKLNQSIDFMTNWISKNDKTMDSIISNIR